MPTLNPLQKRVAQAIVNIFETGHIRGEYGRVTLLRGDTGRLTYGRSQTTLGSGNLYLLIKAYCAAPDAELAAGLRRYLARLEVRDGALDRELRLHDLLRRAGDDPVMRSVQDAFFDRVYWAPALRSADFIGARTALGTSIVYDGRIHGSWHALRDATNDHFGELGNRGEAEWFGAYVKRRRRWLATHRLTVLHATVYRMDSFRNLMGDGKWDLDPPVVVRGLTIDASSLEAPPAVSAGRAGTTGEPILKLRRPFMRGPRIRRLQRALSRVGVAVGVGVDGVFGRDTDRVVRAFQNDNGLEVDGIVGPATWALLDPAP